MAEAEIPEDLRDELRTAWQRYVDLTAPLRPALHGYCRRLTCDLWDAEDLVQETLVRAFARLGSLGHGVASPRAYLLRTATHAWIDTLRHRSSEAAALDGIAAVEPPPVSAAPDSIRDAGATLLQRLSPQEQAAVILKDVFEMKLEEIADVLATTTGAVKAALHRGRERLRAPEDATPSRRPVPSVALVDRFIERFHARDLAGLLALVTETAQVENVGCGIEIGRAGEPRRFGFFEKAVHGHEEWPPEFQYESSRMERRLYEGEPIVLGFVTRQGREAVEQVIRLEETEGSISRLRGYAFCPETMRALGEALGVRVRTGLYRYPTPAPGKYY